MANNDKRMEISGCRLISFLSYFLMLYVTIAIKEPEDFRHIFHEFRKIYSAWD